MTPVLFANEDALNTAVKTVRAEAIRPFPRVTCKRCNGAGYVSKYRRGRNADCYSCYGDGTVYTNATGIAVEAAVARVDLWAARCRYLIVARDLKAIDPSQTELVAEAQKRLDKIVTYGKSLADEAARAAAKVAA